MRSYIKTGEGKDNYIYVLYPPLEADRFFKHEVLGRLYARIMGAKQYQLSLNKLAHIELSREGFEEVSEQFKSSVIENWDAESEEQFASIKPAVQFRRRRSSGHSLRLRALLNPRQQPRLSD